MSVMKDRVLTEASSIIRTFTVPWIFILATALHVIFAMILLCFYDVYFCISLGMV